MKHESYEVPNLVLFSNLPPLPLSLGPDILSTPFSNHLSVRNQVSHTYKSRGEIILLHISV